MILSLSYGNILKSTSAAAVPLYLGANSKSFTKWVGVAAELSYNPHLRNGWVTVDTGVKGRAGSPLIEFSTWEASNSAYNITIPNSFAFKFLVSANSVVAQFLARSSVEAQELWVGNLFDSSVVNSWDTGALSSAAKRSAAAFQRAAIFYTSQRWSPLLFSRDLLDAARVLPTVPGWFTGLVTLDFFYRDLTSNFLFARKAVKHRQYRVRFALYDSARFAKVSHNGSFTSLLEVNFARSLFFKSLIRKLYAFHTASSNFGAGNFDGSVRSSTNKTFRCLVVKLNVLVLALSELGVGMRLSSVWGKLLSDVVENLVEMYAGTGNTVLFQSSIGQRGLKGYLTTKISRLISITSLSGVALFTLIVFVVKTFSNLFRSPDIYMNIAALQLYSYKFSQLRVKSTLTSAYTRAANSVFLSSHVSSANFLTTYSCHRGNRLRAASNSRKFRVRRGSQLFRRRRNRASIVGSRTTSDGGAKLFFRKRWKRLLKYFKVSSSGAQFNFVFFWSFNFFNFTNLKVGYRKFFYLSVRVIYFFRQFLKFFKFYTFYFQLLRALEFTGEALFSGARAIFNNAKLFSLLLFRKFGRVVWSLNSFCLKLFALRWKKLSIDLLSGLRQARGIVLKNTMFGALNFSTLSACPTGISIRVISNTYRQLLSKNFKRGFDKAKTVRSYLRYLLHLRQQISGVWENKLLIGLSQLAGRQLNGAFSCTILPVDAAFKRLFLLARFRIGGRSWKFRVSRVVRELSSGRFSPKQLWVFDKLLTRFRARRVFALRCLKRELRGLLENRLLVPGSRKYLTFVDRVTSVNRGRLGGFSRNDLRVATLLAARLDTKYVRLSHVKKLLLTSKQCEVAREFVRGDAGPGVYCSDGFYSLAESFQLALANCGQVRASVLLEKNVEVATSVALVSLIRVLSANSVVDFGVFTGSRCALWGARLRGNKSFLFCSGVSWLTTLPASPSSYLKLRVGFFDRFGLQYSRICAGSFVRSGAGFLKSSLLTGANFRDLGGPIVNTPFAFIANIFGGLSFFLASLFSLTLLFRFLRANFFVGISLGLSQQLFSRLFWRKNSVGAVETAGLGSFLRLGYLKRYLGRTAAFFQFSGISFLQSLATTNSLSTGRGNLINRVVNYPEYSARSLNREVYTQEDHILFSCGADRVISLKSFNVNSPVFAGIRNFNRPSFPFSFYGRAGKRVRRSLGVVKKLFSAGRGLSTKYYTRVKFFNRLVHVGSVWPTSLSFAYLKYSGSSSYSCYLRSMVGRYAPLIIAARRTRTLDTIRLLGAENPAPDFVLGGGYSMAFLKRLLGVAGLAFFRASRANRSFQLACQTYLQDSRQFLAGVRGIRPLKLFAHAKRIGLWPKNLKLRPVKARQKQPSFKLVTYRHSRAALLKSNKVKMPPSIFSRENYESMNLVWDFPHQNYKFAHVNSFQRMRAWRHVRRQMIRRLFAVVFKKLRVKSYKRAFRYRKYLRKRWFRMKLKRRVLRGLLRAASKLASIRALRRIYVTGNAVKNLTGQSFINHSTRLTYALVLKTFVISLYTKFGHLRTLNKTYFLKTTKLQFLFLVLRGFFLKMLTFFSSYAFIQKLVFNEFLSKTHLFAGFAGFLLGLCSTRIGGIPNSCIGGLDHIYSRLLGVIAVARNSGFAIASTSLVVRDACNVSKVPYSVLDFCEGFTRFLGILLNNSVPLSWSFSGGDSRIGAVNMLFETVGFHLVRFTRRRTRQSLKNITLLRANVFSKPSRSVQMLRMAARRGLVVRNRAHLKSRLQKLLKSWSLGRVSLTGIGAGLRAKTVQSVRLRWIYLQLFWYLKDAGHYVNLARILSTASRIVKNRRHRFLLTSGVNFLKSYSNPIWMRARKKRVFTPAVRYWRRKKIRRQVRLRRRVARRVLPIFVSPLALNKKRRRGAFSSLFWNRQLHILRRKTFFVNNFGGSSRNKTEVPTRFPSFGNLNLKGSSVTSTGSVRAGRALKFYSKRRMSTNNFTRAFLLRRFKSGSRILMRRGRLNKKRTKSFQLNKVVKQEIKPKRLLRLNTSKFFRRVAS